MLRVSLLPCFKCKLSRKSVRSQERVEIFQISNQSLHSKRSIQSSFLSNNPKKLFQTHLIISLFLAITNKKFKTLRSLLHRDYFSDIPGPLLSLFVEKKFKRETILVKVSKPTSLTMTPNIIITLIVIEKLCLISLTSDLFTSSIYEK